MKDVFIEPKRDEAFANISEDLINDDNIRYIFPTDKQNHTCYKIHRQQLKNLIDSKKIKYDFYNEISEKDYSPFFERRSVLYTKAMLEHWGQIAHF